MSNMSYCRFQNTARDLSACKDAIEALCAGDRKLSSDELAAAKDLVGTCIDLLGIVADHRSIDLEDEGAFSDFDCCYADILDEAQSVAEVHEEDA